MGGRREGAVTDEMPLKAGRKPRTPDSGYSNRGIRTKHVQGCRYLANNDDILDKIIYTFLLTLQLAN